jgi:hypothetical protein
MNIMGIITIHITTTILLTIIIMVIVDIIEPMIAMENVLLTTHIEEVPLEMQQLITPIQIVIPLKELLLQLLQEERLQVI